MATAIKRATPAKKGNAKKPSQFTDSMLAEFFSDELKDIYWAEKHLVKTLPKMKKAASSSELQQAFMDHLEETKVHVERLEQVFELLDKNHKQKNAMQWLALPKKAMASLKKQKKEQQLVM